MEFKDGVASAGCPANYHVHGSSKKAVRREATVTSALQKTVTAYFSNKQLLSFCFARQTVPRSCGDNKAHRSAAPATAPAAAPATVAPERRFLMTQDTGPSFV